MKKIMTAGPTMVRENVMAARALPFTNPDLDMDFFEMYKETCGMLEDLASCTTGQALILGGEGMLGLEAAAAALTEKGDRVLIIENGIFGRGFDYFAELYGGEPITFSSDYKKPIDVNALRSFLEKDHDFKYASLVHVDTPTGVLNDVREICNLLSEYGILSVVDSVAGLFGESLSFDSSKIDILLGGSQKALSAPPGLTMVWVSDKAWEAIENRKTPIASYYANLLLMKDYFVKKEFPYTMPISDINGLRVAIENVIADGGILTRHREVAMACRGALTRGGLELYLESGWANTVTAFVVPENVNPELLLKDMVDDYGIMLSDSLLEFKGKLIRIGHMGENAYDEIMIQTLKALTGALRKQGFEPLADMAEYFRSFMK